MSFIDTHCHLDFPPFAQDIAAQLAHWRQLGIAQFIIPAVAQSNWQQVIALANEHPDIFYGLGIHPWYAHQQHDDVIPQLESYLACARHGLVTIGECGLDRRSHVPQTRQLELFTAQLELACHYRLPLIIHSVRAHHQVIPLLQRYKPPRGGVIHAFSGSLTQAKQYWQLGFKLGIGAVITYENAHKARAVFQSMPLEALVLETDSPDMPLQGKTGEINTPAALLAIAETLMSLRQESRTEVISMLMKSSHDLFHQRP